MGSLPRTVLRLIQIIFGSYPHKITYQSHWLGKGMILTLGVLGCYLMVSLVMMTVRTIGVEGASVSQLAT